MTTWPTSIRKNSWVKIKKRGRYNHDLGFVLGLHPNNSTVLVALVPRNAFNRKRKRTRPEAALFNADKVMKMFGGRFMSNQDGYTCFKKERYKDGLLCQNFSFFDLIDTGFEITHNMVKFFRQSKNRVILDAINNLFGDLQVDDRVRVVSGAHQGLVGRTVDVAQDGTLTFNCEETSDTIRVLVNEVRRHFRCGDFVEVFRGDHLGVEGFVIMVNENEAELYIQPNPEEANYKAEGYQVSTKKLTQCAE